MTEVEEIPQLFATKIIDINGTELEIKGFRGNDYAILRSLNKLENETLGIQTRFLKVTKGKEGLDLKDEEIELAIPIRNEIQTINEKVEPLIRKLGQRGIKRAFYPKLNTEKIDKIKDVEIEYPFLKLVYETMSDISSPSRPDEAEEKKSNP